ncbi:MAG TPA: type I-U CRISPR-associated protein Csb2 [Pirellulales bacterium]|nr:type I-U CRISPR-associated protein Csb2 [Pirellulales bacterium]
MVGISLRFCAGRFHATPWGHHVNEGVPEWPPSPWRLLRSLIAVWKRKLDGQTPADEMRELLAQLAAPPTFRLPAATTGHTRHYMPWFKKGPADKTKVFDAFIALRREDDLAILWPDVNLTGSQRNRLATVLAHLLSLGRAESWCEARLLDDAEAAREISRANCSPLDGGSSDARLDPVMLLCADGVKAFSNEHTPKAVRVEGRGKLKQQIESPVYDPDWHVCMETVALHDKRWSDPPGSRWITYGRQSDCFNSRRLRVPKRIARREQFQIARYAIDSAVLPLLQDALTVAERARRGLPRTATFFGKDEVGQPAKGHRHAYYLPTDEDGDGRLDHLTVVAENGFTQEELRALDRMQLRWLPHEERPSAPISLVLMGLSTLDEVPRILQKSRMWVSATPFIVTRQAKRRGRKRDLPGALASPATFTRTVLLEELGRLAERRGGLPRIEGIEPLMDGGAFRIAPADWVRGAGGRRLRLLQFKRFRQKRGDDGGRRLSGAFRIWFSELVCGPICLGHSCHFGMGLFLPAAR